MKPLRTHLQNPGLSRRDFLRRGGTLALGAAAAPQVLPWGVIAAEGQPGANDRIQVGFVGIGRQAGGLLRNVLLYKDARFVAVADVNFKRAQAAAQRHGAEPYKDYRKLLERKDVDAIVTATPDHWRALVCIHACQAGKDIYAEKPMTLTIREGRLMVEAVRKYQRVFQTGSQQRSTWANHAGCQLVRSGALGKIRRVITKNYPSPWECALPAQPVPADLDWDLWCGPLEPVPYHQDLYLPRANPGWISFRPYSGGEMTGWGAHGLDQVQWALGMDTSGPLEVWTEGAAFDPPTYRAPESRARGEKICSEPKVFFRYAGDIVVELGDGPSGGALFIGEKGRVRIDRGVCDSDPEELGLEARRRRPKGFVSDHIRNWLNCIQTRERPTADVEIGHRSTTVCHLGNIARWVGRKLRWDPVKEEFPGDAEANRHLDRPRRKGYELPSRV
ncbi:MAG: Gfo/Idh/MocA family oxidoreductase [Verrucomicrobia bacterium]|nr:Gfo/Idh/MocA family oxidoreductase [Verrucomicrobiota bacterium]